MKKILRSKTYIKVHVHVYLTPVCDDCIQLHVLIESQWFYKEGRVAWVAQ